MDDNKSPFLSNQTANSLPTIAKESNFFKNTSTQMSAIRTTEDLSKPTPESLEKNNKNSFIDKSSLLAPTTTKSEVADLVPQNKIDQSTNPQLINKSSVSSSQINTTNLLKTDGINKTNSNISEIANKNKEIMAIDERIKQFPASQMVKKTQPANVINNYSGGAGRGSSSAPAKSDTLSGIRNTMRSYPAWRTEMG